MIDWKFLDNEVYLYDGTFNGLLTIAFDCYVNKCIPSKIQTELNYLPNLLENIKIVPTDEVKAKRIFDGVYKVASFEALYDCYNAFLSCSNTKEMPILKYVLNSFEIGPNICNMLSIDYVLEVTKLRKNVLGEAHRLKGLVRLCEIGNNLWYSSIHPDNNVIENIGQFLMKRFSNQNLILHDKNRNLVFLYNIQNPKNYEIIGVPPSTNFSSFSRNELDFQTLWKTFFNTISIKERTNTKLQTQFVPKKYRKDLIEFNNNSSLVVD